MSIDTKPTNDWRKHIKDLKGQQHYLTFVFDLDSIYICCWEHQIGLCCFKQSVWQRMNKIRKQRFIPFGAKTLRWSWIKFAVRIEIKLIILLWIICKWKLYFFIAWLLMNPTPTFTFPSISLESMFACAIVWTFSIVAKRIRAAFV